MAFERVNKGFYVQGSIIDDDNNDSYDISTGIEDIMVKKSFVDNSFPLFVVDIKTTEEMRDIMRDHNIRVSLRISSYNSFQADITEGEDTTNIPEESVVFNGTLRIYEKPFETTASKKEDEGEDTETVSTSVNTIYYRLTGIPESLIEKNSKVINSSFEDAKVEDVLINSITSIDPLEDVYIQKIDNKEQYDSILIPPLSLIPAIEYLQNYYGIYNSGLNIFLDNNKTYIYSPLELISSNNIKIKVVDINSNTAENTDLDYIKMDEDDNFEFSMNNSPAFKTEKKISGDEIGSNTIYYSYDENFNLNKRSTSDDENYEKVRYFWNGMDSILKEREYNNISKADNAIKFFMNSINPELITPLTEVSVESPVSEVSGQYFISEINYLFNSTDYKHYSEFSEIACIKK